MHRASGYDSAVLIATEQQRRRQRRQLDDRYIMPSYLTFWRIGKRWGRANWPTSISSSDRSKSTEVSA